jgi:hypothetical protein
MPAETCYFAVEKISAPPARVYCAAGAGDDPTRARVGTDTLQMRAGLGGWARVEVLFALGRFRSRAVGSGVLVGLVFTEFRSAFRPNRRSNRWQIEIVVQVVPPGLSRRSSPL